MYTSGLWLLVMLGLVATAVSGFAPSAHLTAADKQRLHSVFHESYQNTPKDVKMASLTSEGYSLLERKFDNAKEACELFKIVYERSDDLVELYYSAVGAASLGDCVIGSGKVKAALTEVNRAHSIEALYRMVRAAISLGHKFDGKAVDEVLRRLLKTETGALSQAYSYRVAVLLPGERADLKRFWVDIEDILQQADEVDGSQMYFEGGLEATATVVSGIVELVNRYGEAPPTAAERLAKMANYLLARRHVRCPKAAVALTAALKALSRGEVVVPLVVLPVEAGVVDRQTPLLQMTVSNLWGEPAAGDLRLTLETVKNVQTAVTVMSRQAAVAGALPGLLEVDLAAARLHRGFYSVKLELRAANVSAVTSSSLLMKVVAAVTVDQAELLVRESDQQASGATFRLTEGVPLAQKVTLDGHHRMELRFYLKEGAQNVRPHQVFVSLTHGETRQEVVFVAEADKGDLYKFVLDLEKVGKDFDHLSGEYEMALLVGDALMRAPLRWRMTMAGGLSLQMPHQGQSQGGYRPREAGRPVAGAKRASVSPLVGEGPSQARPLIAHSFRPADTRAPDSLAAIFTVLCGLAPLLLMLILWGRLLASSGDGLVWRGAPSVGLHLCLAAIFGLYYLYWTRLDMFACLRALLPLGAATALCGNVVLRGVAAKRHSACPHEGGL